jgi:hypothetical protein
VSALESFKYWEYMQLACTWMQAYCWTLLCPVASGNKTIRKTDGNTNSTLSAGAVRHTPAACMQHPGMCDRL